MIARPIAELPESWKDGREVLFCQYKGGKWEPANWDEAKEWWDFGNWVFQSAESLPIEYMYFSAPPVMPIEHPLGHLTPQDCTPEQFKEFWESLGWTAWVKDHHKTADIILPSKHLMRAYRIGFAHEWSLSIDQFVTRHKTLAETATTAEALAQVLGGWK